MTTAVDQQKIGERIKEIRTNLNMSQKDFAKEVDISLANLGRIEKGELLPNLKVIIALADKFKVDANWISGITDVFGGDRLSILIDDLIQTSDLEGENALRQLMIEVLTDRLIRNELILHWINYKYTDEYKSRANHQKETANG